MVSKPIIFLILVISSLLAILLSAVSKTLSNLPFKGNIPYFSLPTTLRPAIAIDLAESPSVKINIQSSDFLVPASIASSNLGIPLI